MLMRRKGVMHQMVLDLFCFVGFVEFIKFWFASCCFSVFLERLSLVMVKSFEMAFQTQPFYFQKPE
jgi:hypothetical protein